MKTIHKYPLKLVPGPQVVQMPASCHNLTIGLDPSGQVCVWAAHDLDPEEDETGNIPVVFRVLGTGEPYQLPEDTVDEFLGHVLDGVFIWHVFASFASE